MSILLASNLAVTATLGILLLSGLLLIYCLLRTHLLRFEGSLLALSRQLEQYCNKPAPEPLVVAAPLPVNLEPLALSVAELQRSLDAVEEHLESVAGELNRDREVRLREMVERRFHGRGYQSIQILGDLADGFHGAARISIEGQKGGVTYKGHVILEEGQIVDEKMTSSHEIFP